MGGRMGSGQSKPTSSTFFWVHFYCLSASFIQAEHTMCGPPRCISRVLKLIMCTLHTPSSVCMCVQQALGKKLGWLHILWPPENTHQRPADSQHRCCMAYLSIFPGLTDLQPYIYYCNTVLLDVSKMALKLNNRLWESLSLQGQWNSV